MTTPNPNSTHEVEPGDLKRIAQQGETLLLPCEWCKQRPETWAKPGEPHTAAVRCSTSSCPVRKAGWISPGFWNTRRAPVARPGGDAPIASLQKAVGDFAYLIHRELHNTNTEFNDCELGVCRRARSLITGARPEPTPGADGRYCAHHDDDPAHGKECYESAAAAASSAPPAESDGPVVGEIKNTEDYVTECDRAFQRILQVVKPTWSHLGPETSADEIIKAFHSASLGATPPPTSTSDNARRAAEEIVASVSVNDFRQVQRLNRVEGIAAIISKYFAAAPADDEAESSSLDQIVVINGERRRVIPCPDGREDCEVLHTEPATTTKGAR